MSGWAAGAPARIIAVVAFESQGYTKLLLGGGRIEGDIRVATRLVLPSVRRGYADAQIDDTQRLPRRRFRWHPPLQMTLQARASSAAPLGTLGFGFWNDPFTLSLGQGGAMRRLPASPRAIWFFYGSPPNDFAFTPGMPGHGWKAMSLDGPRLPSLLLLPAAAAAVALSRVPFLRRLILTVALSTVHARECPLGVGLGEWHTYNLEWRPCEVIFRVDGEVVLAAQDPPPPPLGFVTWIDNQYAVISPDRGFGFGFLATREPQWLELRGLRLGAL